MSVFWRRRRLPADQRPRLAPDERVVAWTAAASGAEPPPVVIATNLGLFLPDRPDRLGWHEIHHVAWDGTTLTVTPGEVVEERPGYLVTADQPPVRVALRPPGDLPRVVRGRVTRSVPYSSRHRLPGGDVLIAARQVPGQDGLRWTVRYDPGVDGAEPRLKAATDALVAQLAEAATPPA